MDETGAEPSAKPAQTPPEDPLLAPRLTAGQLALLHRYGEVRQAVAGVRRLREFAARNRLAYIWLDVETTPAATVVLRHHGTGPGQAEP
jgi:hypothetical protein